MLSKKGSDVAIMDLREVSTTADYFVLCTADSDIQVRAIADEVWDATEKEDERPWHEEGRRVSYWIVLDYVNVVAHIFHKDARTFYNLEHLWADAKITRVRDTQRKKAVTKKKTTTSSKKKKVGR
jgi:ribosome-associated protein